MSRASVGFLFAGGICTFMSAHEANAAQPLLPPNSLIISSSTYDNSQGAISALAINSPIGTSKSAPLAIAGNDYVNVWSNATPDGNFGVTTPIVLTAIEPHSRHVFGSLQIPSDQVVTSFSSKSEGSLHFTRDASGAHITLVGYAGSGVGALDVSNSDAVAGQDPTNPVTLSFGSTYAFHRTIVSVDSRGHLTYTPTVNYGGDNGRGALLGSNGLYYTVGNSNNGSAAAFNNPTSPNVIETTGLEAVNPINSRSALVSVPDGNSAEVDPLLEFCNNANPLLSPCPKSDKPGKDNNYRGLTEFEGALYFTKGSGSNGMNTVYTVNALPTVADAASATISVVPGFPTDPARTSAAFAPYAVFFANATTMYVTDDGSASDTDATSHAGLQKWSLVNGAWQLDYVLTNGLIGTVDTSLYGYDGQYPDVTTVGLRDMTGVVDGNKVTLWASTSTTSASGDPGADPNKVVQIVDDLCATTVTRSVARETFSVVLGPTYGKVYRGVAYVTP